MSGNQFMAVLTDYRVSLSPDCQTTNEKQIGMPNKVNFYKTWVRLKQIIFKLYDMLLIGIVPSESLKRCKSERKGGSMVQLVAYCLTFLQVHALNLSKESVICPWSVEL
jgi:hypothetical protein